ncbi:transcriptional regulator GcvA [Ferruginivarius sediminum]|nr:transcriptional regulator GcvA [Ferruginivarius sediminum]
MAVSRLHKSLPSVGALVAFEAAARHLSITQAARELGLTQAAVSRKVRGLEDDLGVTLFRRLHRAMRLTSEGERLQAAVSGGLHRIAETAGYLRQQGSAAQISVSTSIAFATFWLMPRIPKFRAAYPDIELRITAFDPYVDPGHDGVDAAIRYGSGNWPGLRTQRLFDEEIFPVCSPGYLSEHPELSDVDALKQQTLLHLDVAYHSWIDWGTWFREMGEQPPPGRRGLQFNTYTLLIQAATAGQGVALGWRHLVDDFLDAGALIRPLDASLHSQGAYYVVRPDNSETPPEVETFTDWVLREAEASGDGEPG